MVALGTHTRIDKWDPRNQGMSTKICETLEKLLLHGYSIDNSSIAQIG